MKITKEKKHKYRSFVDNRFNKRTFYINNNNTIVIDGKTFYLKQVSWMDIINEKEMLKNE